MTAATSSSARSRTSSVLSRYGSEDAGVAARQARAAPAGRRARRGSSSACARSRPQLIEHRRRARAAQTADRDLAARRALRRVLRPLPLCRDRRPDSAPSRRCSAIWPRAGRWTGWSAAMSASARPRWRCAPPSSRHGRRAGGGDRADDAALPPAFPRPSRERFAGLPLRVRAALAPGQRQGRRRDQEGARRRAGSIS